MGLENAMATKSPSRSQECGYRRSALLATKAGYASIRAARTMPCLECDIRNRLSGFVLAIPRIHETRMGRSLDLLGIS
jgi:hypothetical protein